MKASKVTCIVLRDISPAVAKALGEAGIATWSIQSGRSVVLRERKRFLGLSSTTVLEDDPVDIYRVYVKPRAADGLLGTLAVKADLATGGRGAVFSEDVDLDMRAGSFLNAGAAAGPEEHPPFVSGLVGICCIVQRGQAAPVIRSVLESGSVPTITFGEGMGVRDKLGLLRIAIPAEKELVSAVVTSYDAEQIMNILIDVGRLDQPGKGFIYLYPIRKGILNTKTQRGQRAQGASMEQVVAAIDQLKGSPEWRKMETVVKTGGTRKYLKDLTKFNLLANDGMTIGLVHAAMAIGAPGSTISRFRQLEGGDAAVGTARETADMIVGKTQVDGLIRAVSDAGLYSEASAGLLELGAVTLACTYLGGK